MLTWELVGAVIGAGLASGREISAFFARYGKWGYSGAVLSGLVLLTLADVPLPERWKERWPEWIWKTLLLMLLISTGGAMLSGAGEVFALTLPIRGAYYWGIGVTLLLSWRLAYHISTGLAWVSRMLLCALSILIVSGLFLPPMKAVQIEDVSILQSVLGGITYGGFNAALQASIMATVRHKPKGERLRHTALAAGIILLLLCLGTAVLLRHPALIGEEMPFLKMMLSFGKFGYWLGAISLYLAILSTLTACLRGIGKGLLPIVAILIVSMLGFTGVVGYVYPFLGGGCFTMLIIAKLVNCTFNPFHSRKDMI